MQALEQLQQWDALSLERAHKHIRMAQKELLEVISTSQIGSSSPVGFHADVNRGLLGPLPPRPVQVPFPSPPPTTRPYPFSFVH